MTDLRRLSDHGADEFERGLLDAAHSDAGSELALERALRAFSASPAAGAQSASSASGASGASALVKLLAGCFAAGVLVAALGIFRTAETRAPAHGAQVPLRDATNARLAQPSQTASVAVQSAGDQRPDGAPVPAPVDEAPRAAAAPPQRPQRTRASEAARAPASAHAAGTAAAPSASPLAAEVRLLQATRSALAAGNSAAALALLDQHAREFGAGVLVPEATVLRVQALIASGDRGQARAIGERFLVRHPSGAHASRIRALLR